MNIKVMFTQGEDKRRNEYQNGMSYGMAQFVVDYAILYLYL